MRFGASTRTDPHTCHSRWQLRAVNCGPVLAQLLTFAVSGLLIAGNCLSAYQGPTPRPANELAFTLSDGSPGLLSHYRGKVVALQFILTTCSHCQAASQMLTRLQSEYGARGFQALDLAINGRDEGRDPKAATSLVEQFVRNFSVGFPVGWITREQMAPFMQFSVVSRTMVPQLALIDRKGNLRYQTPPSADSDLSSEPVLRSHIQELLAEDASPKTRSTKRPTH
jgi:thiol-disulfide isomerase/thioredoxin